MTSANLKLPFIEQAQAQKEVTHAEALNTLDALVQGSVINRTTSEPPVSPSNGQRWIVGAAAVGDWEGQEGNIAAWYGGWTFHVPRAGWRIWNEALAIPLEFNGTVWVDAMLRSPPQVLIPTLAGDWINYGSGFGGVRYYKAHDGLVTIEGVMQAGADGVVFTLLGGYRPADTLMFSCWSGGGPYRVDVRANGEVAVQASNIVFSSLAGIKFYAA